MSIEIIEDWPPNIEKIRAVLPVTRRNIFAYDGVIYSPGGPELPPWLIAHEEVHFDQQWGMSMSADENGEPMNCVDVWWDLFLKNPKFRLMQEMPAHQVEWLVWNQSGNRSRNQRRVTLKHMAGRLASPMYGNIISVKDAKREISRGAAGIMAA